MILINLLPHREAARKRLKDAFNVVLVLSALAGGVLAGCIFLWLQAQISQQKGNNDILRNEIVSFDVEIKKIAPLEGEFKSLQARQKAVEDLQADRNTPVHLLTELVRQLPEGMYITSLRQDGNKVILQGTAQSNERVSELLRNLSSESVWLTSPTLIEIVAGSMNVPERGQYRVANFVVEAKLLRPNEVDQINSAAAESAKVAAKVAAPAAKTPVEPAMSASAAK